MNKLWKGIAIAGMWGSTATVIILKPLDDGLLLILAGFMLFIATTIIASIGEEE